MTCTKFRFVTISDQDFVPVSSFRPTTTTGNGILTFNIMTDFVFLADVFKVGDAVRTHARAHTRVQTPFHYLIPHPELLPHVF